ncbi:MAG TPA: MgtC/SapB family protein [Burkholderiales bacterium]|nr:MgtC/SapB family protein [Burkholderiales bacterium]
MFTDYIEILQHLVYALLAGSLVGFERSYHGRPAGFRTHALVCLSSSLLMLVTLYQARWFSPEALSRISLDPTRMAQGIMTGIGFLGAGVIMKEGLSVRGLTTAASIWITAAIGILFGVGFYFPAITATFLTLCILSAFRWVEVKMPTLFYAHLMIRFGRNAAMEEEELRKLIADHGFSIANLSYRVGGKENFFEYTMTIRSQGRDNARHLAETLGKLSYVLEFKISPTGD